MAPFTNGMLLLAMTGLNAESSKVSLRQAKGRLHVGCLQNITAGDCDVLMGSVIKEKEREMEVDMKLGRKMRQLKTVAFTNSSLPGDGHPPGWHGEDEEEGVEATRLRDDCEEPEDAPEHEGGFGPAKVYCCHTLVALVDDLKAKKAHCDSDPPVDCWKSLRTVLPNYISHYESRMEHTCRTTTTTTAAPTAAAPGPAPCSGKSEEKGCASPGPAPAPAPGPDWCMALCQKHTEAEKANCEALCAAIHKEMVHKDDCSDSVKEATDAAPPAAPAPSNK